MRVLGIDPGYDRIGVAILEKADDREQLLYSHCIETDREAPLPSRLYMLGNAVEKLLREYHPDVVALETLYFNKNQKTAMGVAEARGIIIYAAQCAHCTVQEFSPQEVKVAVTGYGKSDKNAVFSMLHKLMSDIPEHALDDEYDAIAVGITALAHRSFKSSK